MQSERWVIDKEIELEPRPGLYLPVSLSPSKPDGKLLKNGGKMTFAPRRKETALHR